MYEPHLQRDPLWTLIFKTVTEVGKVAQVALPLKEVATKDGLKKALWNQGLPLRDYETKEVVEFIVSWIEKLQKNKASVISSAPFGWEPNGFIYGGQLWTPSGAYASSNPDPVIARQYAPHGKKEPWVRAAKLITSQGRPALDAIVASAFAAPLVKFTREPGVLLSTYSPQSGVGKTTALRIAQAVWGDPVRAMQGLDDTQNSVAGKIGQLQSLPVYWDELKSDDDAKRFVNLVFKMTGRKDKARMNASASQKEVATWQTMLISASNDSIMDHVVQRTKQTLAGFYRVFEYQVQPSTGKGQIDQADASQIVGEVDENYGVVGLEYAQFLGSNHNTIKAETEAFYKQIGVELATKNEERFWRVMVATLLLGATYANRLGFTTFDLDALKRFLFDTISTLRNDKGKQSSDMDDKINVSNILAQYLNEQRARHTIRTNKIHNGRGRPVPGNIKVLNDASRLDAIRVHVGIEDKLLRMSSTHMAQWLHDKGYSRHLFMKSLMADFRAKQIQARIATGTEFAGAQEHLLEIDLNSAKYANFLDEA